MTAIYVSYLEVGVYISMLEWIIVEWLSVFITRFGPMVLCSERLPPLRNKLTALNGPYCPLKLPYGPKEAAFPHPVENQLPYRV